MTWRPWAGLVLVFVVLVMTGFQVRPQRFWGGGGWRPDPYREGLPVAENGVVDRGFTFCRLLYTSVRREQMGHGWNTDYPGSDHNFLERLEELTTTRPAVWADGQPGYAVVRPMQDELFQCPFLFLSDAGTAGFSDDEVRRLRLYLQKGGLIYADDFWGDWAWDHWASQLARILPEYPIADVEPGHTIMEALYRVPEVPQVPSIQFWRRTGRSRTSERGSESAEPHLRAIFDEDGRPLVVMTHNTDIADGWEREGEDDEFFYLFSPDAYALGINIVLYALTH
ncbi:MAG: DUF4159 domain-containing protein [Gemmatimonadetes bacterium]|nr:DUF4159 domain-containing protein [Gemmatimonadota bacterium]NNM33518.1 DUF4159 domain-containing protein [Gemmatimonadota bacterium]